MHVKPTVILNEIAKEAYLSITTISGVLRNRGETSNETIQLVPNMAKEIKYRPNMLVRVIQTGKTGNIGVIVPLYYSFWT
jgi:DNA-binding LacI/PurR family transcriptional regulator